MSNKTISLADRAFIEAMMSEPTSQTIDDAADYFEYYLRNDHIRIVGVLERTDDPVGLLLTALAWAKVVITTLAPGADNRQPTIATLTNAGLIPRE